MGEVPPTQPGPDAADLRNVRLVRVAHARDPFEAELLRGLLVHEGIDAVCQDTAGWQMLWHMGPALHPRGLPVLVRQEDEQAARDVLAAHRQEVGRADLPVSLRPATPQDRFDESPEESMARRGQRAAIVFFLTIIGIVMTFYAIALLWRGRSTWDHPDPEIRRRCRRQLATGWAFVAMSVGAMLAVAAILINQTWGYAWPMTHDPLPR
jgi:hypothetical protein